MKTTLATMRREMKNHPPYSPDVALSDLNLFGPMKVHLGGQKFQTDYEPKSVVSLTHYSVRFKFFILLVSVTDKTMGKCVSVKREHLGKECEFGDSGIYIRLEKNKVQGKL
jgi:hypothetical protein